MNFPNSRGVVKRFFLFLLLCLVATKFLRDQEAIVTQPSALLVGSVQADAAEAAAWLFWLVLPVTSLNVEGGVQFARVFKAHG